MPFRAFNASACPVISYQPQNVTFLVLKGGYDKTYTFREGHDKKDVQNDSLLPKPLLCILHSVSLDSRGRRCMSWPYPTPCECLEGKHGMDSLHNNAEQIKKCFPRRPFLLRSDANNTPLRSHTLLYLEEDSLSVSQAAEFETHPAGCSATPCQSTLSFCFVLSVFLSSIFFSSTASVN